MMRKLVPILILPWLGMLTLGCGDSTVGPAVATDVRLDLALSAAAGSPQSPLTIIATANNVGGRTIRHTLGCGCPGIEFELIGPDGQAVFYADPCQPQPGCPCGPVPLAPGASLQRSLAFAGDTYRRESFDCVLENAPSGTYTVVARYQFFARDVENSRTLERRATFHWTSS